MEKDYCKTNFKLSFEEYTQLKKLSYLKKYKSIRRVIDSIINKYYDINYDLFSEAVKTVDTSYLKRRSYQIGKSENKKLTEMAQRLHTDRSSLMQVLIFLHSLTVKNGCIVQKNEIEQEDLTATLLSMKKAADQMAAIWSDAVTPGHNKILTEMLDPNKYEDFFWAVGCLETVNEFPLVIDGLIKHLEAEQQTREKDNPDTLSKEDI